MILFESREEAAALLADRLASYRGARPLVLAIPCGAVSMGRLIADRLDGDFDVVLVRKLRAPGRPEQAIGSVDERGHTYIGPEADLWITDAYIERERRMQMERLAHCRSLYTPIHPPVSPTGRTVILVDDGAATGATMIAALRAIRAELPAKLVVAMAVAPRETLQHIEAEADQVACLVCPDPFPTIGSCFRRFPAVSEEQVCALLGPSMAGLEPVRVRR